MNTEAETLYKLMILYILSNVKVPLDCAFIAEYITSNKYTDYISTQSIISALVNEQLISENDTYKHSMYEISTRGKEMLQMFGDELSSTIKAEIIEYLKKNKKEITNNTSVKCDYTSNNHGSYTAICSVKEGKHDIFSIGLDVPTEEEAIKVCNNFISKNSDIFAYVIKNLM